MTPVERAQSAGLPPLETLYDGSTGAEFALPTELTEFYGALRFPLNEDTPYIIANLVTSLDGIVSLGIPGKAGGKEISGSSQQDVALMGVLRAAADAVVVGAGTLREGKGQPITGPRIYPPLARSYTALRETLEKNGEPLAVIVTASGDLDPSLELFNKEQEVLIVTSPKGARHARETGLTKVAQVVEVESEGDGTEGSISATSVLDAIRGVRACRIVLVEGGPHLLGDFFAQRKIDEQFLTLSPQIVGRDSSGDRLGLVEDQVFAPDSPRWGKLSVVKRGVNHLFLRYVFNQT